MDKYEEFNSKKFLILLLIICTIFFVIIIKSFEYIPDESTNTNTNKRQEVTSVEEQNTAQVEQIKENQEKKTLNISLPYKNEAEEFEDIEELPSQAARENSIKTPVITTEVSESVSPEEEALKIFVTVQKLKADKQYVKALEELQKVPNLTEDKNLIAKSYEEIGTLYAIEKRYGTALSFAQKAYNMSPSTSRETLLARLYYKTGEIDKATKRINNVLQRDFSADR